MAFDRQLETVIRKLTDLTRAEKVVWQKTAARDTFLTVVGNAVVTVGEADETPDGSYFVRIKETGKTAAVEVFVHKEAEDWRRIKDLLDLARQSSTGWTNKVVSDLLSTLEAIR